MTTDSQRIPDLNLFSHGKRHRSPTKQFIEFDYYKLNRGGYNLGSQLPEHHARLSPSSIPSSERPRCEEAILYPRGFHEYIRPPSTYLDYAEGYLIGEPLPFRPPMTGRFPAIPIPESYRRHENTNPLLSSTRRDCYCENEVKNSPIGYKDNKSPNRTPYLNLGPKRPETPHKNPYLEKNTHREEEKKAKPERLRPEPEKQRNNEITDNSRNNAGKILADFLGGKKQITENESVIEKSQIISQKEKQHLASEDVVHISVSGERKKMVSEEVQTIENNRSQVNRSSVLIEKLFKNIPSILDEQTFKKMIKEQMEKFNSIKIEFEDDIPIIDFEDLIETKEQYFEFSKQLQSRLNRLIGDKAEYKPKNRNTMTWPDL